MEKINPCSKWCRIEQKLVQHTKHTMKNIYNRYEVLYIGGLVCFNPLVIPPVWSLTLMFTETTVLMLISESHDGFTKRLPPLLNDLDLAGHLAQVLRVTGVLQAVVVGVISSKVLQSDDVCEKFPRASSCNLVPLALRLP